MWNTVRRGRNQILYVVPPFIVAYSTMQWAIERYVECLIKERGTKRKRWIVMGRLYAGERGGEKVG